MSKTASKQGGFTLLEILIAIALLAIGMVTIFTLFPIGILAIKGTVEGSRGTQIARSARSELEARRVDMAVNRGAARYYTDTDQYFPAGPWQYPSSLSAFDDCVYQFMQAGVLRRRVVFDDRTMVPIRLTGAFTAPNSVTVVQTSITRESDWLKHFYDFTNNTFAPWDILLRVYDPAEQRSKVFLLTGMALTPPAAMSDDIMTLTVDTSGGVNVPNLASTPFEVLLPVAMREAPTETPQAWSGAYADFSGGSPYSVTPGTATRNLVNHLENSWISLGGDWFRVGAVTTAAGVPTSFGLPDAIPAYVTNSLGGSVGRAAFDLVLPCVSFASRSMTTQDLTIETGVPEAAYLVERSQIEVVLDGAWGTMSGDVITIDPATLSADTQGMFVVGNFVRVDGRDYQIASVVGSPPTTVTVLGTLPLSMTAKYFNIVLGYRPAVTAQVPLVGRFTVLKIDRTGARPVVTIGEDANGNLPDDFGLSVGSVVQPIHILPRNWSQYAWQASLAQKSLAGAFDNATDTIDAPSRATADAQSPVLEGVPFPLNANDVTTVPEAFRIYALTSPLAAGVHKYSDTSGMADSLSIQVATNTFDLLVDGETAPFLCVDRNDFVIDYAVLNDLTIGDAVYANVPTFQIDFTTTAATLTEFVNFIEPGVYLQASDPVSGASAQAKVLSFDRTTLVATLDSPGSLTGGETVTVTIVPADATTQNFPLGSGHFLNGASVVPSLYPVPYAAPFQGFPYAGTRARRFHLEPGDYIRPYNAAGVAQSPWWYAVKAIVRSDGVTPDYIVLDRPFVGNTGDWSFKYYTPIPNVYRMQTAVFRNFKTRPLYDDPNALTRTGAAAFGFDETLTRDPLFVHLARPLPPDIKPGDFIRAEGDADHAIQASAATDLGLADAVDGDGCWYMIDMIDATRLTIQLASPYRGYVPPAGANPVYQPASVSSSVVHAYDTLMGAF